MNARPHLKTALGTLLLIGLTLLPGCGGRDKDGFSSERMDSMDASRLKQNLESYFVSGELPVGDEKEFLKWAFQKDADLTETYVRDNAEKIANLPWYLSDGAWDLVRDQQVETGIKMLTLARELYPNNPDVLGITGIIAYLNGDKEAARRLFEEAESWRSNRPIVDFYLGGLLVTSDSMADVTRGKSILMKLVGGNDKQLLELAGLTLLGNVKVPMIREDLETLYSTLDQNDVFRLGNSNLPAEVLRIAINRMVALLPEQAMTLADLLMQYPNRNVEDMIGMIRLAQASGDADKARQYLDELQDNPTFMETLEDPKRLDRIRAVQLFMEEDYEAAMEQLRTCLEDPDLQVTVIQQTFQTIIDSELPISVQREVLNLYLTLPVNRVRTSLGVLSQLIRIEPLKKDDWISYAIEKLLPQDPTTVGSWLNSVDASEEVIKELSKRSGALTGDEASSLVNALIADNKPDLAQQALDASRDLIDPIIGSFFQAQILLQQGNKEAAMEYWEEAHLGVVGNNRFTLMKGIGLLALQLEQPVNAYQSLYTALTAGIPFNQQEAARLIQLAMQYGTLRQAIQVAEYLEKSFPANDLHKNNLAYFKFLADEQVEPSIEVMRELTEEYPDIPQYKLTLALGLVKAGRSNEAKRLVDSMQINWQETSDRGQMIYAVVLAAVDERTLAQALLQNIDQSDFILEEKALLEGF